MAYAQSTLSSWRAALELDFERRSGRTILARRSHDGPLVIQKPLYPEGEEVCHGIVAHPPGGIAGGDALELSARLGADARALLTAPGAAKWYRSAGAQARQRIHFTVETGACLEWLPQENIVFDGALAELRTAVRLSGDARFIGWEVVCLGRTGSGEKLSHGKYDARTLIERDGRPLWLEHAQIEGGNGALASPVTLACQPVVGTLLAASLRLDGSVLEACRKLNPMAGDGAVTLVPGLLVGRYLGASSESAKNYFIGLWKILRPALIGREGVEPRIWRT